MPVSQGTQGIWQPAQSPSSRRRRTTYSWSSWRIASSSGGARDAAQRAGEVARRRLAEYEPPPLDDAIREELSEYVTRRRRELGD